MLLRVLTPATYTSGHDERATRAFHLNRWTGDIEGPTAKLGDEFTYRYKDIHYSKQKVTESIPGKRVVWRVVESRLSFVQNKTEWNGTEITFDIAKQGDKTELRFTHVGLVPDHECYEGCSSAWGSLVTGNLRSSIAKGKGRPNLDESRATSDA